jgi:predicted PurR-regulated permease PerM
MTQGLEKNGKEQQQDRRVAALELKNSEEHHVIRETMVAGMERIEGKLTTHRTVAIVAWMILVALGGYIAELYSQRMAEIAETIKETSVTLNELNTQHRAWEKYATKWGEEIDETAEKLEQRHDKDVEKIKSDIKNIERRTRR